VGRARFFLQLIGHVQILLPSFRASPHLANFWPNLDRPRILFVSKASPQPDQHNYDKHDIVSCGECGESFVCLCNRATECPCAQVNLSRDEAEWIGWQTGNECVCQACLLRFRDAARLVLAPSAASTLT
jgi:hypothetical protein